MALPPISYTAPLAQPAGRGLMSIATVIDVPPPARLSGGVEIQGSNCSASYGQWPADPCADTDGMSKQPERGEPHVWPAITVWGADECDPDVSESTLRERSEHDMKVGSRLLAEESFYSEALDRVEVEDEGDGIVDAVARLEAALGQIGIQGVIHAPRALAAHAETANLVRHSGNRPKTPLGHYWSFGAGYVHADDADQVTMVATSPVFVWRSEISTSVGVDHAHNLRTAVSERMIVAGAECVAAATHVDISASGGGGGGTTATYPSDSTFPSESTFPN